MNIISYITGDAEITDFPSCSARPLAAFVQSCNDVLAGTDGYLSPEDSLLALDLAWQTVGTTEVSTSVVHAWVAEMLASPAWGIARYAKTAAIKPIFDIAELHRRVAAGETPTVAEWDVADRAGHTAARIINPTLNPGGVHAARAAYQSIAIVDTDQPAMLDTVSANALRVHVLSAGGMAAAALIDVTRHAIRSWRDLTRRCGDRRDGPSAFDGVVQRSGRCDGETTTSAAKPLGPAPTGVHAALRHPPTPRSRATFAAVRSFA